MSPKCTLTGKISRARLLPQATKGGYTVEEIGGQTRFSPLGPVSAYLRDPMGPSYTAKNPRTKILARRLHILDLCKMFGWSDAKQPKSTTTPARPASPSCWTGINPDGRQAIAHPREDIMKALPILLLIAASASQADTTYITPNIPGTTLPDVARGGYVARDYGNGTTIQPTVPGSAGIESATEGGYRVQELGGNTTVYHTLPGSAGIIDATRPSYTIRRYGND